MVDDSTQHGDCQIVLMEKDRLTAEDMVESESKYQKNIDEELAENVSK